MSEKIGLVLAGGGGKGAYHIGVWRALREFGVDKNIGDISGTSVGALNAVLFALGDYDLAESVWLDLSYDKILSVSKQKLIMSIVRLGLGGFKVSTAVLSAMSGAGFFTRKGLQEIMSNVNFDSLRYSDKNIFAGVYNTSKLRMEYLKINGQSEERIRKILMASSALPIIYPSEKIDGNYYIDGGISDNVPLKPLYDEGCKIFIVVHLSRDSLIKNIKNYEDAKIFEIVPSSDQGNILTGTLDFSRKGIRRRMQLGYDDTYKILEPIYNIGVMQKKFQIVAEAMQDNERMTRNKLAELNVQRQEIKSRYEQSRRKLEESFNFDDDRKNILNEREHLKDELRKVISFE